MSWYSHYVLYLIDAKIDESLNYINIFEDVFQKNQKILVLNKIDEIKNLDNFKNNKKIQKFIKKNKINNIFYVNSIDNNSVSDFKNKLFQLIQDDIFNKIFTNIKEDDFSKNPCLFHKQIIDRSSKIGC